MLLLNINLLISTDRGSWSL